MKRFSFSIELNGFSSRFVNFDKSFKEAKCAAITIVSSNINEAIKTILNFFIQKFHEHKKHKKLTSEQK